MNASAVVGVLQRQHRALVVTGVVLLVVCAWVAATAYAAPVQESRAHRETAWTESSAFTYVVPVTRNSTHLPIGSTLPMGEPAYFRTVSDTIHVDYAWTPSSPDPEARGVAGGRMWIEIVATAYDGRPYWTIEHTLDEATAADATRGLNLSGDLALDDLVAEVRDVNAELPVTEGSINWSVRASVVYAFEAGDRRDQGETHDALPIEAGDPRFKLPQPDDIVWTKAHTDERVVRSMHPAGIPGILSQWRMLAVALAGVGLLVAGMTFARSPEGEPFDRELGRFKDWVSTAGRIPDGSADPYSTIDVRSLEDLVHVAADARTRVVLDERSRVFYAFLPGATYRYARHAY